MGITNSRRREIADKMRAAMDALGAVEIDGIPLPDLIEPSEADEWVDGLGGLGVVRAMCDALRDMLDWTRRRAGIGEDECVDYDELLCILDRRLMPEGMEWPRWDDGRPLTWSDGPKDAVGVFLALDGSCWAVECDVPDDAVETGERVKRPVPKVLDADGVEIRVGDTVWTDYGDGPWTVTSITTAHAWHVYGESDELGSLDMPPSTLTHRAPVLAADGKPLREGETVYDTKDAKGYPNTVVSVELDGLGHVKTKCEQPTPASVSIHPSRLTHERPESWERLEDDATKPPYAYCVEHGLDDDSFPTNEKFARDLVRRARALAERSA